MPVALQLSAAQRSETVSLPRRLHALRAHSISSGPVASAVRSETGPHSRCSAPLSERLHGNIIHFVCWLTVIYNHHHGSPHIGSMKRPSFRGKQLIVVTAPMPNHLLHRRRLPSHISGSVLSLVENEKTGVAVSERACWNLSRITGLQSKRYAPGENQAVTQLRRDSTTLRGNYGEKAPFKNISPDR